MKLRSKMKDIPTDLELLNTIYERYYDEFAKHSKEEKLRESKIYVPIDCAEIAKQLGVDADIIFGRLYYHMQNKYGYAQDDGSKVAFFTLKVGQDRHCVNFPYLASVLATLRHERSRFRITTWIAAIALLISLISIGVSLFNVLGYGNKP
jgi:hypothetical protein